MSQFDRVATPMVDAFQDTADDARFNAVPDNTPLNIGPGGVPVPGTGPANYTLNTTHMSPLEKARNLASSRVMPPHMTQADIVDENFLNHMIWYSAIGWHRRYSGEKAMLRPAPSTKS